jgi:probable phosphoglycerate mutase
MKQLYFLRHGMSEFNKARIWAGSSDTPLTSDGEVQAKLAGLLAKEKGLSFDIIVSSPLKRAHDTAKIFADEIGYPHADIVLHDYLIERKFGKLEGRKDLVAATKYAVNEAAIDKYDGVEALEELHRRALATYEYLESLPHDTILVVGHGAHGRALRRVIKKEPLSKRGTAYRNAELVRFL